MAAGRTYKGGRPTGGWQKRERITSVDDVKPGDMLIKDSHQFRATNLVKVKAFGVPTIGFIYNYATPDGKAIASPEMFTHEFELASGHVEFFRAERGGG